MHKCVCVCERERVSVRERECVCVFSVYVRIGCGFRVQVVLYCMRVHKTVCMSVYVCVCVCVFCSMFSIFNAFMHVRKGIYMHTKIYMYTYIQRERARETARARIKDNNSHAQRHKYPSTHIDVTHRHKYCSHTLALSCAEELGASGSTNIAFPSSLKHKPCIFVHPGAQIFSLCTCFWQHKCCCLCSWEHKHSCSCSQEPKY